MTELPAGKTVDTKKRLLDAAEKLFAQKGIEATSLRNITAAAAANLASIHYHFGSKEALIEAVFARRIEPVNRERLRLLDRLESDNQTPALEAVLHAFLLPAIETGQQGGRRTPIFMRLMGRVYSESEEIQQLVLGQFGEVSRRFTAAIHRQLPHLPQTEVLWRFKFMIGTMAMAMMSHAGIAPHFPDAAQETNKEVLIDRLIRFLIGGFNAPVAANAESDHRQGR